ncbi:hypothetical protein VE04_02296 [Pseudogymnoascus sp. 24MN13]|nr:hypothetical protein VE04_02296 [Pseudogymnoascus sp. 24MN13]
MVRQRRSSAASEDSGHTARDQELGSMYDYLAKIVLLGPSGSGKSCLLHRFIKNEWRSLSSQTIGVEFASKIIRIGTGSRMKRIKLQLWDTAGTERFRSVSRSYYRGAAGAILVYDITSAATFAALPPFLADARALASPRLTTLLVGNKEDLAGGGGGESLLDSAVPAAPSPASARIEESGWSERTQEASTDGTTEGKRILSDDSSTYAIQVVRQVNYGPLESKRYFVSGDGGRGTNFCEITEEDLIEANFEKLNA